MKKVVTSHRPSWCITPGRRPRLTFLACPLILPSSSSRSVRSPLRSFCFVRDSESCSLSSPKGCGLPALSFAWAAVKCLMNSQTISKGSESKAHIRTGEFPKIPGEIRGRNGGSREQQQGNRTAPLARLVETVGHYQADKQEKAEGGRGQGFSSPVWPIGPGQSPCPGTEGRGPTGKSG